MTVGQAKATITMSEFAGWLEFFKAEFTAAGKKREAEWEHPTPLIWYVIQLTREVRMCQAMWTGKPVKAMADFVLPFSTAKPEKTEDLPPEMSEEKKAQKMAVSKAFWGTLAAASNGEMKR